MKNNDIQKLDELQAEYATVVADFEKQRRKTEDKLRSIRWEMNDLIEKIIPSLPYKTLQTPSTYDSPKKPLTSSRDFMDKYSFNEKETDGTTGIFLKGYIRDFWADIQEYAKFKKEGGDGGDSSTG